jgi:hypothetical protein
MGYQRPVARLNAPETTRATLETAALETAAFQIDARARTRS